MARARPLQNVDPSIQRMAVALVEEFMDYIEAGLLKGGYFYTLRERFLERNANEWVRLYGKETADKAARGIYALEEDECLSPEAKRVLADRWKAWNLKVLAELRPSCNTALNRFWIRTFGNVLYALALAVVVFSAIPGGPAMARGGQEVGPRFRALAACGVAKAGPARDRACQPFNTLERGTWRAYDGPGAGAPREWELPKSYEVDPYR